MLVDVSLENTQNIDDQTLVYPSEVKITLYMWYDEDDAFTAASDFSQEFTFTDTGTQDVTIDFDESLADNDYIYLGYKIEAPVEISDEDFDESDLFETVEGEFGKVYLYPLNLGDKADVQTYQENDTYVDYDDSTGSFSGALTNVANNETPPDPVTPIKYVINGLVPGSDMTNVPSEYQIPNNMPNYETTIEPNLVWNPNSEFYQDISDSQSVPEYSIISKLTRAVRVPIEYADATNELREKVINDYDNIRLKARLLSSIGTMVNEDEDPETLLFAGSGQSGNLDGAIRLSISDTRLSTETSDFFEVDLRIDRPWVTYSTNNDPSTILISDFGPLVPMYALFKLEVEVEVKNPTTGEWSIYAPRIRLTDINYLLITHSVLQPD